MADPVNFQKLGATVKQMAADGVSAPQIDKWLSQAGTDLKTLNASGFGPDTRAPDSKLRSFGIGATQGVTANYGDEMASAIAATVGRPGGEPIKGDKWSDRYANAVAEARAKQEQAHADNPKSYLGGQFAGAAVPIIAAPELFGTKAIANAPTMASTIGRSAGYGSLWGGINGYGATSGDAQKQAMDTLIGTGAGGIIGAGSPVLINAASNLIGRGVNAVRGLFNSGDEITEAASGAAAPATVTPPTTTAAPAAPAPSAPATVATDTVEAARPRATIVAKPNDQTVAIAKITQALKRDGYSPAQVAAMIRSMGTEGTLADAGANTRQLLTSSMGTPGAGKQIGATALENRQLGQQGRLMKSTDNALGGGAGYHETDDALIERLAKEGDDLYGKAWASKLPVDLSGVLENIDQQIAKMPQKSSVRAVLERVRGLLGDEGKDAKGKATFTPYDDLEMLHHSKIAIDDFLSGEAKSSIGKFGKNAVNDAKRSLLEAMDTDNPAYGTARNTFSGTATSRDALEAGRNFIKEDAETTAATLADMSAGDQQIFREGAKRAIVDIIKGKPKDVSVVQQLRNEKLLDKVRALIPDEGAFNKFVQDLSNERRFAETRAKATGGSQSFEKFAGAADLATPLLEAGRDVATGNAAGLSARVMNFIGNLGEPGEASRAAIVQRLLSNSPAEINKTLDEVRRRAVTEALLRGTSSRAGALGATSAPGALP